MDNFFSILIVIIFSIVTGVIFFNLFSNQNDSSGSVLKTIQISIKDKKYLIEIADTFEKKQTGLMYKKNLPKNQGMLFVFEQKGFHSFWMKNTLISLDMIWLDENKEVVYIYENAQPCKNILEAICQSIIPTKMARYVLELNAGEVKDLNLQIGDKVDFNL